jgi:hypothetical protein
MMQEKPVIKVKVMGTTAERTIGDLKKIVHHLLDQTTVNHGIQCLMTVFQNFFIASHFLLKQQRQRRGRFLVRHDSPTTRL